MRKLLYAITSVLTLFGLSGLCFGTVIHVPGDYFTIQKAISAASNGDTVLVEPGIYPENINFLGKAIEVRGRLGRWNTTIWGDGNDSVVTFATGEGNGSVLDGFTITAGVGKLIDGVYYGGGIFCGGTSPKILRCRVTDNTAQFGAGLYCEGGSPLLFKNIFEKNTAYDAGGGGTGGGLYFYLCSPVLVNCVICMNHADDSAGGVFAFDSHCTLTNCTIVENTTFDCGVNPIFS